MHVSALWRYPVKSMRGEALTSVPLTSDGIHGDRIVHVRGPRGPLTGRTRHGLLSLPVSTGPDGTPSIDGHDWRSVESTELVRQRAGDGTTLVADETPQRFDVLNLLVLTDGAVQRLGRDVRRLRPNLVIEGVPDGDEMNWPGRALAVGDALIGVDSLRARCIVTTIDPDTGDQDLDVLREIRRDFGGELGFNCWVIQPGVVTVGDEVRIVDTYARPQHYGGWIVGAPYPHAAS